jgi:phosphotriesterase-related protein
MSVNVHVDYAGRYGAQHAIDCLEEGLPPDRIVIGHMDEQLDEGYQLRVLQLGVFIGLDTFGTDFYFSGIMKLPTDEQRIISLARLIDQGFAERIVLAQDVAFKTHFHAFGGFGYDHLLARIVPVLEHEYGIRQGVIDQLLVRNPRHLLTSTPPPWPG